MWKIFGWILFIGLAALLLLSLDTSSSRHTAISLAQFADRLEQDRVKAVTITGDRFIGEFRTEERIGERGEGVRLFQVALPPAAAQEWRTTEWLLASRKGADVRADAQPNWLLQVIIPLIPWLLIFGFIWFFVFRGMRKMQSVDPNAPRPVYLVPAPPGQSMTTPPMPVPPLQHQTPGTPSAPAPGGDN